MNKAYLLLGGNKGDRNKYLRSAMELIEEKAGRIVTKSSIYATKAWGNTAQPDFLNIALCLETHLSPDNLLTSLLSIEEELGRKRGDEKWMERTIDIDILFYNNDIVNNENLSLPHPFIQDRKFVLIPLAEIAKELIHPVYNKSIEALLKECKDNLEVKLISDVPFS